MCADPYRDEQLVGLYDIDNAPGDDHAYYRALADRIGAKKIIDLGCGTGLLTRSLATSGREVIGVDPSETMLGYARRQPGAELVRWVLGDAAAIGATGDADLAVSSGNSMMHIAPDTFSAAARSLAAALRPGGMVSFESRNPGARQWEHWTRAETYSERQTPFGHLREWLQVTDVERGRVAFDARNIFEDGTERTYTTVLYFRTADEIITELGSAGFTDIGVSGGWHAEPVTADRPVLVFHATKPYVNMALERSC